MTLKRRLLKKCLENTIADRDMDIPVYVDSLIVFSAPKGQYIRIDDRYRREKHCFRTSLNKKIENYLGCAYYKEEQLTQLGEIFSVMESNVKRFETELNYDEVRRSLAGALAVLQDDTNAKDNTAKNLERDVQQLKSPRHQVRRKRTGFGHAVASVFAGLLISGVAAVLSAGAHRN